MSKIVVIGGVAGGASAAARLRRNDESAEIILLERGKYVSFATCGLPYHIGGVIPERNALLVSTPEKLRDEFNLDVRTQQEVTRIDPVAKTVEVRNLAEGGSLYQLSYDKLVLAPGAMPLVPPIIGVDLPRVYRLRDLVDMDFVKAEVDNGTSRNATVIGGGFIGLEVAENLIHRGLQVTVVEMLPQVMALIDSEMAAIVHRHLRDKGVRLILGDGLRMIQQREGQLVSTLASGREVAADFMVLAIGVTPGSTLAREAGLEIGPRGHIVVNPQMQTSDPDIYAVGDVVQVLNPVTQQPCAVPLAGPANRQGRIAADAIAGKEVAYRGTVGTSIVKVFDLAVASVGVNSRGLQQAGIPFMTSINHSNDHVSYYPGATVQSIKLLYAPDSGKLLGAQVVGTNAVDRTIDVLAVALQAGMTVYDLEHLELAYAPPFGAAKDPVNIAGFVASNALRGDSKLVSYKEVVDNSDKYVILDVRTDPEWDLGHIPGAVHIENIKIRSRLDELDRTKPYAIYCRVGRRAYVVERLLRQHGFDVVNITGGWTTYEPAVEPQSSPDAPLAVPGDQTEASTMNTDDSDSLISEVINARVDARGLQCPGPIVQVFQQMQTMQPGDVLEVLASDPGFKRDAEAWAQSTGNRLMSIRDEADGTIRALFVKGNVLPRSSDSRPADTDKTILVFSSDFDKVMAAFVVANGALATGQKVTMFFTFWGLNALRRTQYVATQKTFIERMFGMMMPKGLNALRLSKLNMLGIGTALMKNVMKQKQIDSLSSLVNQTQMGGARLIACQMTMDMMGFKQEELIPGVELGGVATFINSADRSSATLVF
ncbi:MAG: FAD-dependent oxidoreductase [Chloroflexi bacterium]|nr:FAD-dependent oxidoreductase [Chloroflexota bacterium]